MYSELLILLLAVGGGYGKSCSYDSDCTGFFDGQYCCSTGQCCYFRDSFSIFPKSCSDMFDCNGDKPFCCNNKQCCSFSDTAPAQAAQIATGVIVAICVVIALVIIGCCVGIVLCCRRQTNYGRVVRVPAAATTTTVHQTHTVMQPHPYQPGMQAQYPPAPNKDQPPPYCPPAYTQNVSSYPAMPQPAVYPNHGVPYPDGAPTYPMPAPVQQNPVQASAPPMM